MPLRWLVSLKRRYNKCSTFTFTFTFHQAQNYVKAIYKIIKDSGAEDLATAGLCLKGTGNKMFGEKADYYQTMHTIRILSEAMWHMYWEAFEL